MLARALPPVTGVDLSPGMIEVAGHLELPEGSAPIEYLVGAAEDLPIQARSRAGGGQVWLMVS
jgi:ubiquinone/menaquinone biosynthesis C-methylase UbiE